MVQENGRFPAIDALHEQAGRIRALVRTLTPADLERPTPCKGWLVRDIVAHNADGAERINEHYLKPLLDGRATEPFRLAELGRINLAGAAKYRDEPDLLDRFDRAIADAAGLMSQISDRGLARTPFQFSFETNADELSGLLTADLATHQWDYGKAIGRYQAIDPAIVGRALPNLMEGLLPKTFLPEKAGNLDCTFGIRITNVPDAEWVVSVNHGTVAVKRGAIDKARVKTVTDAESYVLLSFGRLNPILSILRGKVKTSGNPFLGMKFGSLFQKV